jgi:uncharacterized protein YkwD
MRYVVVLGAALLMLALPSGASAGVSKREKSIVRAISDARERHGLRALRGARQLHRSAGRYSRWQLRHGYFGHQPRIRMSSSYGLRAEVLRLHWGWGVRARRTVRMWMRSPSHRSAILHGGMRAAGVGVAKGRFRGRVATVVTVHMGAR